MRIVSLVCATGSLVSILSARSLGVMRFLAATMLAVFPPAVLFAVDARAYAMCAMFVTLGLLALHAEKPFAAALALVAAAYCHYYGALFLPLLLIGRLVPSPGLRPPSPAAAGEGRGRDRQSIVAFAAACVAFLPGVALALQQPVQATGWVRAQLSVLTFEPLSNLSFAALYPDSLFLPAPVALVAIALVLFVIAIVREWNRFALMTLVPLALVIIIGLAGRSAYVPMRFESVLATPLMLWIATSLHAWKRPVRLAVALALIAIGLLVVQAGVVDHFRRRVEPYRYGASVAVATAEKEPVVASGYLYLETITLRPATAFPAEQALHPGWRATATSGSDLPSGTFIWVGELRAPELAIIEASRRVTPLYVNKSAAIVKVN